MSYTITSPGPTSIHASTATGAGQWYRVHPRLGKLTFQVTHTGTTDGVAVASTVYIQASNDGVNPLQTTAGTSVDALGTVVLAGGSPQSAGFTIDAAWQFVRVNTNALSTGSISVQVGAGIRG